ncbi:hypothetical protein NL50_12285 [Clostridium acetobutylicum]|nr:hypothetical protein NL50_12285 [Clostridium acetobutylicum]
MKFVTLFPEAENIHLNKDVGMIPRIMSSQFKIKASLVCYNNGLYPNLKEKISDFNIQFIKRYTSISTIDSVLFLLRESRKIDVLNLFHLRKRTLIFILVYKIINKHGKVYLKLDANRGIRNRKLECNNIKNLIRRYILKKCKLISVETSELYEYLNKIKLIDVKLIPNGFYDESINPIKIKNKKNYILTVGRIGAKEKANEIMVQAFIKVHRQIPDWKLKFVGSVSEKFKSYMNDVFEKYPEIEKKIEFTGPIYDRKKLNEEYMVSKIFCLTSIMEGFPMVFLEAIKNGCYIISSDLSAAKDITNNMEFGDIFQVNDSTELSRLFLKICNDKLRLEKLINRIQKFAYENFRWQDLCKKIKYYLDE